MTSKTQHAHYTARAIEGRFPFVDDELSRSVWQRLRRHFPNALAALLMPNHLHLVAPDEGEVGRKRLSKLLGATARSVGRELGTMWERVPEPQPLASRDKVLRMVRYTWLNPCRPWRLHGQAVKLVDDPLLWSWSSLRDTVGAVVDPWVPAERVAEAFGWPRRGAARALHDYAVGDDTVREGLPFPSPPAPSLVPDRRWDDVVAAALAATRLPQEALRRRSPARRALVGLAYRQGWNQATGLAEICGVHPNTVTRAAANVREQELLIAARCLHPRLIAPYTGADHVFGTRPPALDTHARRPAQRA